METLQEKNGNTDDSKDDKAANTVNNVVKILSGVATVLSAIGQVASAVSSNKKGK